MASPGVIQCQTSTALQSSQGEFLVQNIRVWLGSVLPSPIIVIISVLSHTQTSQWHSLIFAVGIVQLIVCSLIWTEG